MDMEWNLNRLRVFHAAARRGSFTRASEDLHLTQPGISKHIRSLEEDYGARLFERRGRKVSLTQAGEILYEISETILTLVRNSRERIDELNGLAAGKLTIAASVTVGTYILPALLVGFRRKYPGIEIKVEIARSRQVAGQVLDGTVELGLAGHHFPDERLVARPFMTDRLVVIVSNKHRWANRRTPIRLPELVDQPFLLSKKGSGTWSMIDGLLVDNGVRLESTVELGTTEAVKQAVAANQGISIVSSHVLARDRTGDRIRSIPIAGGGIDRELLLLCRRTGYLSEAAKAFLKLLPSS